MGALCEVRHGHAVGPSAPFVLANALPGIPKLSAGERQRHVCLELVPRGAGSSQIFGGKAGKFQGFHPLIVLCRVGSCPPPVAVPSSGRERSRPRGAGGTAAGVSIPFSSGRERSRELDGWQVLPDPVSIPFSSGRERSRSNLKAT